MLKHVVSATVFAAALTGLAVAQTSGPATGGSTMPKTEQSAATQGMSGPSFLSQQASDQVLAKTLIGVEVTGVDGKKIGSVKDVILNTKGEAVGILVSHGGVLGVGDKQVGIPFRKARIGTMKSGAEKVVRLDISAQQFDTAPEFKDMEAQDEEREKAPDRGRGQRMR